MEMLKDESERKAVKEVIHMEEELLLLQLEQTLRDEHNKEKEARYGLKTENKVLHFVKNSINGLFIDFTSNRKKEKVKSFPNDEKHFLQNSIRKDPKSMFHLIKRRKYLQVGDETILTLDVMFRLQSYIQTKLKNDEQVSFKAATDLHIVKETLEKFKETEKAQLIKQRNMKYSVY